MPEQTLIIFCASFPFGERGEYPFLGPEVLCHARRFDRVILVPYRTTGDPWPLPERVVVDSSFAGRVLGERRRAYLGGIASSLAAGGCWREWLDHLPAACHPRAAAILLLRHINSLLAADWARARLRKGWLDAQHSLFYSYWLDYAALGLGALKREIPGLKLVARAHGSDLYAERYRPAYIPFQASTLKQVDRLFVNSQHGLEYLAGKYPGAAVRLETALLGVHSRQPARPSDDGVLRLVSCSSLLPVKRVDLLFHGIARLAESRPDRSFEWRHFGDGPERAKLDRLCASAPDNLICTLLGQAPNQQVLEHYRLQPVDLFLNTSSSEGLPVSILEALSFGVPVVAPAVGGIPEMIAPGAGRLLSANPQPGEIAAAAWDLLNHPEIASIRAAGRLNQQTKFDAETNYNNFSVRLRAMLG